MGPFFVFGKKGILNKTMKDQKQKFHQSLVNYLFLQSQYQDSPYSKFVGVFGFYWIIKNLNLEKKEKFLSLLKNQNPQEINDFLKTNIPNFYEKIQKAIEEEIKKIETSLFEKN
jgi:hypothetical protein